MRENREFANWRIGEFANSPDQPRCADGISPVAQA